MFKMLRTLTLSTMMLTGMTLFGAQPAFEVSDAEIATKAAKEVRMYSRYTIWDNIQIGVKDGHVELMGDVSQPFKKADLGRLMHLVPGVQSVTNSLNVLPTSFFDDQLRIQIARAIFRDPALSRYAIQAVPPIHIVVNNGQVTLEGVVNSELEKTVAGIRANTAGLSLGQVVNNLKVENAKARG